MWHFPSPLRSRHFRRRRPRYRLLQIQHRHLGRLHRPSLPMRFRLRQSQRQLCGLHRQRLLWSLPLPRPVRQPRQNFQRFRSRSNQPR